MNSFCKGFVSLFDWMIPLTTEERLNDLDNQMQDLYDRMGWGKYPYPNNNSSYVSGHDIARILEAENEFNLAVDDYIYWSKQNKISYKNHNPLIRDPARKRINKYY